MTIGEKIRDSRRSAGLSSEELADMVGVSSGAITKIERGDRKFGAPPEQIIKIAEALRDDSILMKYIETNPVYQLILPRIFPELNNIRRDPAIIFTRVAKEANEAAEAAGVLAEVFSNADPTRVPRFEETFKAQMEQIIDVKRAVEILEFELLAAAIVNKPWIDSVYASQQSKCVERGHHVLDADTADV